MRFARWVTRCGTVAASALCFACVPGSSTSQALASDAGRDGGYLLPPVIDATVGDTADTRARVPFRCGTLSGAVTADLWCDHEFLNFAWDFEPKYAVLSLTATVVGDAGEVLTTLPPGGMVFHATILTPPPATPLTETCATLPPLPRGGWLAVRAGYEGWLAACNSATEVLPGSSFELHLSSVGTLTAPPPASSPLDASADGFDWDAEHQEVLTNSFHGELKMTIVSVDADASAPIFVRVTF